MTKIDLGQLSRDELKQLEADISRALQSYEIRRKNAALAAVEAKAREMGFTIAQLTGEGQGNARSVSAPKYQHLGNQALTWSGRGRKPNWFVQAVVAGTPPESMLIT